MGKKFFLDKILKYLNLQSKVKKQIIIKNIANLDSSNIGDITFCSSSKYLHLLKTTKASACIISKPFEKYVPSNCFPIISQDAQIDFIKVSNLFYEKFVLDYVSKKILKKNFIKKNFLNISFGENFICEMGVKIGKNVKIGNNVIIKENCIIQDDVNIGSNVIISNSTIHKDVNICDGSVIGKKGFGFKFYNGELIRVPHIGRVIIKEGAEIGSNCNIDRGSFSDTIIGKYTFLDNQIQIGHNVQIGNYCMLAAQVGVSGSVIIGDNVKIGGQAGISGHLKIGNNVKIGGKSGVIKNIDDNKTVMGYPAIEFREFIKKNMAK